MLVGVPALAGQIEPAAESKRVVDHNDLLVMRSAGRMRVVELEMNAAVRLPAPSEAHFHGRFPILGVDHRKVPVEYVDVQAAPPAREVIQIFTEVRARI